MSVTVAGKGTATEIKTEIETTIAANVDLAPARDQSHTIPHHHHALRKSRSHIVEVEVLARTESRDP